MGTSAGGGGGGYYGGGGADACAAAGGGGSGFGPAGVSFTSGVRSGDGKVILTYATPSSTSLGSTQNPSVFGQAVTFTATVTGDSPTGSVDFVDPGRPVTGCGAEKLISGQATCTTSDLSAGSHNITAVYGGDVNNLASISVLLTQTVVAPVSITTTTVGAATLGRTYTAALQATGGLSPYTWSLAGGQLPPGLSLDPTTGTISGTPTASGNFNFSVKVTEGSALGLTATQSLSLSVSTAAVEIALQPTTVLTGGQTTVSGVVYDGAGNPISGAQVTIGASAGTLAGTPATTVRDGTFAFVTLTAPAAPGAVTVTASIYGVSGQADLTVLAPLAITTTSLTSAAQGQPYSATLDATGGQSPYTWSVIDGHLPPGLSLDPSGSLSGTPTAAGSYTVTVQVAESSTLGLTALENLTLTVVAPSGGGAQPPVVVPTSGAVGSSGGTLTTTDGNFSLTLPAGAITGSGTLGVSETCPPPAPAGIPSDTVAASCVFTLAGANLTASQPASIRYNPAALGTLPAGRLSVYRRNADGSWSFVPTAVNTAAGTVRAYVTGPETVAVLADTQSFSDIPAGYWAAADIDAVVAASLADGFPNGTFQPDGPLTRAELVKLLDLTLGLAPSSAPTPFSDVTASDWYTPYVSAAVQAGLVQGLTPTTFGPNATVSREQMAVLLARALKLTGGGNLTFSDASQIDGYAHAAVQAVVGAGYMSGFPDGTFQPLAPTTRAQAAKILAEVIAHLAP